MKSLHALPTLLLLGAITPRARAVALAETSPVHTGAVVAPLYPAASLEWNTALGHTHLDLPSDVVAAISKLGSKQESIYPALAAKLDELDSTPAALGASPHRQRRETLSVAVDFARESLLEHAYQLDARSRVLAAQGDMLDRNGRAELFTVLTHQKELKDHEALFDETTRDFINESFARTMTHAIEVRDALLGPDQADAPVTVNAPVKYTPETLPGVEPEIVDLYRQMSGKGSVSIATLRKMLAGYGFTTRDGIHFTHPESLQLHGTFSDSVRGYYAKTARSLIERLARLRSSKSPATPPIIAATRPAPTLKDLEILIAPPPAPAASPARLYLSHPNAVP